MSKKSNETAANVT